jgi:L-seryl-tRNA(Ser) seleniumtransferase
MKFEPHLPQLPSLGELLEHPRVKGVVTRINRSTIAQRAAGFLDELRSSLVQRAGKFEVPPVGQLAERLARRLLGEPISAGPIINATGVVVGDPQLVPPLADAALHAMVQAAGDYHGDDSRLAESCTDLLRQLTAAEAALVVSSFEAGLALTLSATAGHREALVCGEPEAAGNIDWQRVGVNAGAVIHQGGVETSEVIAKTSDRHPATIVRICSPNTADLQPLAANKGQTCLIDAAPLAGLLNPSAYGLESVDPLNDRLTAGADLVVADGAGLIGGPSIGVIIGKRTFIDAAAQH